MFNNIQLVKMVASRVALAILLVLVADSLGRNVPGPDDPDTYPGKTIKYEVSPGVVIEESLIGPAEDYQASKSDIKIFFHCNTQPEGVELDMNDPSGSLKRTHFNPAKTTFIAIHGWKNDRNSEIFKIIKGALIPSNDVNLFIVDWSKISMKNYITARWNVADVGKLVGDFMKDLVNGNGLSLDHTQIVGHSLGAHVSGFVGFTLDAKVKTIIGLDPAWPLFYFSKPAKRLNDKDAKFVQIIHTNGGLLGFPYSIGVSDYYPNGGFSQAGCFLDVTGSCAHGRAYQYYGESVTSGNFVSWNCDSYKHFKGGSCKGNPKSTMGQLIPDAGAGGDYYLDTNTKAPFAQGG